MARARKSFVFEILAIVVIIVLVAGFMIRRAGAPSELQRFDDQRVMLGTIVSIAVFSDNEAEAPAAIDAAFAEMAKTEDVTNRYSEDSEITRINANDRGRDKFRISTDIAPIIGRSLYLSKDVGGAFDVTIAPLYDLWSFEEGASLPEESDIEAALELIDYEEIKVISTAAYLWYPRFFTFDLDGIAKGWAVDRAVASLERSGIERAIVDAGGDIGLMGTAPEGGWVIGVKHPREDGLLGTVTLDGGSIATSGDYQRFVFIDGVRYHHILDPTTGYPARGVISATVTAELACDADALATAVFVMGPERGMQFVEETEGVEAIIVTGGEEMGEVLVSSGLAERFTEGE